MFRSSYLPAFVLEPSVLPIFTAHADTAEKSNNPLPLSTRPDPHSGYSTGPGQPPL